MGGNILTAIVVAVLVLLICRNFYCWYTKQNEIVALLKETNSLLRKSAGVEVGEGESETKNKKITCKGCGAKNIKGLPNCVSCGNPLDSFF